MVERLVLLISYLIKMTRITPNTIPTTTHQYLLLWDLYYLSEAMVERIVLLLSYLIKIKRITTTTIATTTPPIPPAIGSILLV
jgi:hypothetical protein